jgi:protein farnesyltransferase subunit beta
VLAGLSTAQHKFIYQRREEYANAPSTAGYGWKTAGRVEVPCEDEDWVTPIHPIFVVPFEKAAACRKYFEEKGAF